MYCKSAISKHSQALSFALPFQGIPLSHCRPKGLPLHKRIHLIAKADPTTAFKSSPGVKQRRRTPKLVEFAASTPPRHTILHGFTNTIRAHPNIILPPLHHVHHLHECLDLSAARSSRDACELALEPCFRFRCGYVFDSERCYLLCRVLVCRIFRVACRIKLT